VGIHCGLPSEISVVPARASSGIVFVTPGGSIHAHIRNVSPTELTTTLRDESRGVTVHTVEHLLAALAAHGVDNASVHMKCSHAEPAVPILDGSSRPFSDAIAPNIVEIPDTARRRLIVRRPVEVRVASEGRSMKLLPLACGEPRTEFDVTIDFGPRIRTGTGGHQRCQFSVTDSNGREFQKSIAGCRTFCFEDDLQRLRDSGLIKGGSLQNALVFDGAHGRCLTPGGLKFDDEPCRHKLLDCIGDLSLVGAHFVGRVEVVRPGHKLTHMALASLLSDSENYAMAG
jgi:UDP-3-O-[3-hydroxymyristoyl] N-acetylglucosamine deacetylase